MYKLKDKKVLVVGLGRSGVSSAKFLIQRGAKVIVMDEKPKAELSSSLKELEGAHLEMRLGVHDADLMGKVDMIVLSPGIPIDAPGISLARSKNIPVIGEMELAISEIKSPIIAVTGTNGKTTTTELIGHLMKICGISNCVGGNIGIPITSLVEEAKKSNWVVLEVSSFQLETTPSLKPAIAVLLNITPDHLDRHQSFEDYVDLKATLCEPLSKESWGVYNATDETVTGIAISSKATLVPFDPLSVKKEGGWYEEGDLFVELPLRGKNRFVLRKVSLEGRHNRENMLAAIIATLLAGGGAASIQEGLESFKGLPHRLQLISEIKGIRFYDDSKGTNIGATIRALDSFAEPVVLIAGGKDKGVSFDALAPWIKRGVKKLVLIGEASSRIRSAVGNEVDTTFAKSMEEAVDVSWRSANPGDVVLLSPACASFDMFRDYAHRGDVFQEYVAALSNRRRRRNSQ